MALDGTIQRPDGQPLGNIADVQQAIAQAFPGVIFGTLPGGAEKIRAAAAVGVVFPDIIRQHFESEPAEYGGDYTGAHFSSEFFFGASDTVSHVHVVLRGDTTASEPMFQRLAQQHGWITTHP